MSTNTFTISVTALASDGSTLSSTENLYPPNSVLLVDPSTLVAIESDAGDFDNQTSAYQEDMDGGDFDLGSSTTTVNPDAGDFDTGNPVLDQNTWIGTATPPNTLAQSSDVDPELQFGIVLVDDTNNEVTVASLPTADGQFISELLVNETIESQVSLASTIISEVNQRSFDYTTVFNEVGINLDFGTINNPLTLSLDFKQDLSEDYVDPLIPSGIY